MFLICIKIKQIHAVFLDHLLTNVLFLFRQVIFDSFNGVILETSI